MNASMNASKLFELRNELRRTGVIFTYSGYLTEAVLVGVGDAVKQKLTLDDADTTTVRSVFAVFVEQMQNMIRSSGSGHYWCRKGSPARTSCNSSRTKSIAK